MRASRNRRHLQERADAARAALVEQQERDQRLLQEERREAERAREKRDLKRTRAALAFQNTLLTAGEARDFRASYSGWGCLRRIVALTEYVDPTRAPTVTVFDMCELLGGAWQRQ